MAKAARLAVASGHKCKAGAASKQNPQFQQNPSLDSLELRDGCQVPKGFAIPICAMVVYGLDAVLASQATLCASEPYGNIDRRYL